MGHPDVDNEHSIQLIGLIWYLLKLSVVSALSTITFKPRRKLKMEVKQEEEIEVSKIRSSSNGTGHESKQDEALLKFLDSIDNYLILMDSVSSKLRQGWLELASARHSMGSSRISSSLFDLKYHHAATTMEVDSRDVDSTVKEPHFTLHKWASTDNPSSAEEAKFEEDELLHQKPSCTESNQDASLYSEIQEKSPKKNESEGVGSPHTPGNHVQKERAKSLSMFGTLVSPKLRATQLTFETVLETLQEIANVRASMLGAYDQVQKETESSKGMAADPST